MHSALAKAQQVEAAKSAAASIERIEKALGTSPDGDPEQPSRLEEKVDQILELLKGSAKKQGRPPKSGTDPEPSTEHSEADEPPK